MKHKIIAIDCDDTITKSSEAAIKLVGITLKNLGIKPLTENPKKYKDLYTQDKNSKEYKKISKAWRNLNKVSLSDYVVVDNAKEVIKKFQDLGYKIYIVSARYKKHFGLRVKYYTKKNLEIYGIFVDKIYCDCHDKAKFCKKHKISLLIDNSIKFCKACKESGINAICYNEIQQKPKTEDLIYADSWNEVYEKSLELLK